MTQPIDELRTSVSLSMKVNTDVRHENAEVYLGVSNIPVNATAEDIDAALEVGKLAYDRIRLRLKNGVMAELRAGDR